MQISHYVTSHLSDKSQELNLGSLGTVYQLNQWIMLPFRLVRGGDAVGRWTCN